MRDSTGEGRRARGQVWGCVVNPNRALAVMLNCQPTEVRFSVMLAGERTLRNTECTPESFGEMMQTLRFAMDAHPELDAFELHVELDESGPATPVELDRDTASRLVRNYMAQQARTLAAVVEYLRAMHRDDDSTVRTWATPGEGGA